MSQKRIDCLAGIGLILGALCGLIHLCYGIEWIVARVVNG